MNGTIDPLSEANNIRARNVRVVYNSRMCWLPTYMLPYVL